MRDDLNVDGDRGKRKGRSSNHFLMRTKTIWNMIKIEILVSREQ